MPTVTIPPTLLTLPLELREQIYEYLLRYQHIHVTLASGSSTAPAPAQGSRAALDSHRSTTPPSTAPPQNPLGPKHHADSSTEPTAPQQHRIRLHSLPRLHPHPNDQITKGGGMQHWRAVLNGDVGDGSGVRESRRSREGDGDGDGDGCGVCATSPNVTTDRGDVPSLPTHSTSTTFSPTSILLICRQIYIELVGHQPLAPRPLSPSASSPLQNTPPPPKNHTSRLLHSLTTNTYSFSTEHFPFRYLAAMPPDWIQCIQRVWLADVTQAESLLNHYRAQVNLPGLTEVFLTERVGRSMRPKRLVGSGNGSGGGAAADGGGGIMPAGGEGINGMRVKIELSFRVANLERLARQFENRGVLLVVVEEGSEGVPWRDFIGRFNVGVRGCPGSYL